MIVHIVNKHFGTKTVFHDFSIELKEGEVSVIKAPSGRGKTTLFRIILGLDNDFAGFIEDPPKKAIAVFQEDRLVESLSVRANLRSVSKDEEKIKTLLDELGLDGELDAKVNTLSGGMKRRVAIIKALLLDYDWLLLDEPFKGLDSNLKEKVALSILSRAKDKSIVVITHSDEDARLFNGRVIEL